MADVLSALRELRSLEQKQAAGSLTPEESARFAELQGSLSRPSPVVENTTTEEVPFVEADLQDISGVSAVPAVGSPFDVAPLPGEPLTPAAPAISSPSEAFSNERTVVAHVPETSSPPQRRTMTWGMMAVDAAAGAPSSDTPEAPAPARIPTPPPPQSVPSAQLSSAWRGAIPAPPPSPLPSAVDDAPAAWPAPAPTADWRASIPQAPEPEPAVVADSAIEVQEQGNVPPLAPEPPSGMLFQWPAPTPAPSVLPPPPESSFDALPIEDADLDESPAEMQSEPAPIALDLPSLDLDAEAPEERTQIAAAPQFSMPSLPSPSPRPAVSAFAPTYASLPVVPPPLPQAPPPLPPSMRPPMPTIRSPAVPEASKPAGGRPVVRGESRVVVHTLEGLQKRGTLQDVDLSAEVITFYPAEGEAQDLPTSKLKAIFFMVPIGQPVPKPEGAPVTAVLQDGRQLEGLSPDYRPGAEGFFLCPLDQRSRAARIYLYAAAVKEIL